MGTRRVDVNVAAMAGAMFTGAGSHYMVRTLAGVLYLVYIDTADDVVFRKSLDGGFSWGNAVTIFSGTATQLSVFYDRDANIAADLIHCAYTESVTDDTLYRTINPASADALSTQTVIFAGASTAGGNHLSIARAVGGNVYCKVCIDGGAEGGFFRLPNANVPNGAWDAARTIDEALATGDMMILLPDFDAADTQDMLAIFWDASANEISRKLYDDSANTWAESSIAGSMTELAATTAWPNFDACPDIANTRHVVVAWSNTDTATARLRCWTVDAGAITAKTDVVSSSGDDQGLCSISIDTATGYWYCCYTGKADGSETWNTAVKTYLKVSTDEGATWGPETLLTNDNTPSLGVNFLTSLRRFTGGDGAYVTLRGESGVAQSMRINVQRVMPRGNFVLLGGG